MQTVSSQFTSITSSKIRELYWRCLISFLKTFTDATDFFTIGSSLIGGPDIIKGDGAAVQEWDKYDYADYTGKVIGFEYTREQDHLLGGAVLSIADVVLNNTDDYFTPGSGSEVDGYVLPYRPIRLAAGFKREDVPVFVGLTEKMPRLNEREKTASFHCIDFMQSIFNYPLDQAVILQDKRTDEVIDTLLQLAGLLSSQYTLDTGFNIIPFFFADKGQKLGEVLRKLAQAEMGTIYMDETGRIRFVNRTNWLANTSSSYTFDKSNIIDKKTSTQDNIINVVEIKSKVRDVLAKQKFWEMSQAVLVPANGSVDIWADFSDPVTTCDDPDYISAATTSLYTTNYNADGSGETGDSHITLSASSLFSKSFKMTFTNDSATPIYVTTIELYATPAKVVNEVYVRVADSTSIAVYDERPVTIENDFIPDESTANSIAQIIVDDNKALNKPNEITVQGVPQLQIGDLVTLDDGETYYVRKVAAKFMNNRFVQTISVVQKTIVSYFRVGISTIGGTDKIAP